jgi:uncharacterized protein (DUF1697 family)
MSRYLALLGGINVGKRRVAMSRLVDIFKDLGHKEVSSYIASGNIIFDSEQNETSSIEERASAALKKTLGYEVMVFVRSAIEIIEIANSTKFKDQESRGATIYVGFMQGFINEEMKKQFEAVHTEVDSFHVNPGEFYWICYTKISQSKVWDLPEAKRLDLPSCTLRNISTIRRLVAKFLADY